MEITSREGGTEKSKSRANDIFLLKQPPDTNLSTQVLSQQHKQKYPLSQKGLRLIGCFPPQSVIGWDLGK